MATEALNVPEEKLLEVCRVLREGLEATLDDGTVSQETRNALREWCIDMELYVERLTEPDQ